MVGHALVRVSALCVAAKFALAQQPTLHLEYINQQHKNVRVGSQPIRAPSTDRISLVVALEPLPPGAQQAGGERLEVRAENQAPGYFENRPPANVSIVVRSVDQYGSHEVPFKIYSSGGGLDPQKLLVFVDLDILVDPIARHVKLRELAARMMAADRKKRPTDPNVSSMLDAVDTPEGLDRLAGALAMLGAVYIAPGEYEITALYTPRTGAILASKPAHFVVFEADYPVPDSLPSPKPPK